MIITLNKKNIIYILAILGLITIGIILSLSLYQKISSFSSRWSTDLESSNLWLETNNTNISKIEKFEKIIGKISSVAIDDNNINLVIETENSKEEIILNILKSDLTNQMYTYKLFDQQSTMEGENKYELPIDPARNLSLNEFIDILKTNTSILIHLKYDDVNSPSYKIIGIGNIV